MSILLECPFCQKKQSLKNKICTCSENLDKAKRSRKVKYWIDYRLPGGKHERKLSGSSIETAKAEEGKIRSMKAENRILDILQKDKTFNELAKWYLDLSSVRKLASYRRVKIAINNFNKDFGDKATSTTKPIDLEEYQIKREKQGLAPATIDAEIAIMKTAITKAFDNDLLDGRSLKAFRKIKRMLKRGSNARKTIITIEEYLKLLENSPLHFKPILITAYNTGMRTGELQKLQWSYIDRKDKMVRLPATITKERKEKNIPINQYVEKALNSVPRAINHNYVFTYKGKPLTHVNGFVCQFKSACEKTKLLYGRRALSGITFHDIRRSVKTNMLEAGVNKVHRDLIFGHSLKGMDIHYLAPSEESLKEAMGKYTNWLYKQIAEVQEKLSVDKVLIK